MLSTYPALLANQNNKTEVEVHSLIRSEFDLTMIPKEKKNILNLCDSLFCNYIFLSTVSTFFIYLGLPFVFLFSSLPHAWTPKADHVPLRIMPYNDILK